MTDSNIDSEQELSNVSSDSESIFVMEDLDVTIHEDEAEFQENRNMLCKKNVFTSPKMTEVLDTENSGNKTIICQTAEPSSLEVTDHQFIESSESSKIHSEFVTRASNMRSKIEDKITEIEQKIGATCLESSSESLETVVSMTDYNSIRVKDPRRLRSCSVSEMRQNTIDRLQSNLEKAEKDLELREEEVLRLRKIRDEVGSEIEDLTASLFEEANNMVRNAEKKKRKAEKDAIEANNKLGILQDEVQALKRIVQSTKLCSSLPERNEPDKKQILQRGTYEVDPIFNDEFVKWRQNPNLCKESSFMKRIYEEDIMTCLHFKNAQLAEKVMLAIEVDVITIEKIRQSMNEPLPKRCDLMEAPRLCPYKMYLGEDISYNISVLSRNRITAVCDLFCYLRYIEKGLITSRIHEVYLEVLKRRRRITSAKLGLVDDVVE